MSVEYHIIAEQGDIEYVTKTDNLDRALALRGSYFTVINLGVTVTMNIYQDGDIIDTTAATVDEFNTRTP